MLSYFEIFAPNPPPPVGWGGRGGVGVNFLSIFSAVREISRTFDILTPTPHPGTPRGGVGKKCIDFLDSS